MINIRSITFFVPNNISEADYAAINNASLLWAKQAFFIRTQRVCMCPIEERTEISYFSKIAALCEKSNIRWFNVPIDPWATEDTNGLMRTGYDILKSYGRSFVNVLGIKGGQFREGIINNAANLVRNVSSMSYNGQDNFRLGISFNIHSNGPFFPFSYSSGALSFSIALELTQDINELCKNEEEGLVGFRHDVKACIEPQIDRIAVVAESIAKQTGIEFNGFDFSLAPIIDENGSVIPILNYIGAYNFGRCGTMFATSYLTDILKSFTEKYRSVGFSGVMYSLLEDLDLCSINNAQDLSLEDLIIQSTMCGCGLDMVPVYENISNEELKSICLEVYAISTRLNKPLGVRILPIPGCKRDQVRYTNLSDNADFIANTKVVRLDNNMIRQFNGGYLFYGK